MPYSKKVFATCFRSYECFPNALAFQIILKKRKTMTNIVDPSVNISETINIVRGNYFMFRTPLNNMIMNNHFHHGLTELKIWNIGSFSSSKRWWMLSKLSTQSDTYLFTSKNTRGLDKRRTTFYKFNLEMVILKGFFSIFLRNISYKITTRLHKIHHLTEDLYICVLYFVNLFR